jgi:transposase
MWPAYRRIRDEASQFTRKYSNESSHHPHAGGELLTLVTLSPEAGDALETLAAHTTKAHRLRRAQALLWLDEGETVPEVAARLRVTRQAVYKWVAPFRRYSTHDMAAHLAPGKRPGRPRPGHGVIEPRILAVIDRDPRELGSRATVWTAPLLGHYLLEVHHLAVSRPSMSFALARLGLRWKRPRHDLARRPATGRQATGGANAVWRRGSAPSS